MRRAGVSYSAMLEWYLCAHWWGYTVGEWNAAAQEEQEEALAVYRCHHQIDAVLADPRYRKRPRGTP